MKLQDYILPFILALFTTLAIQYFWFGRIPTELDVSTEHMDRTLSGRRYEAPRLSDVATHRPLNTEIDFFDEQPKRAPIIFTVDTHLARYEFSDAGAVLKRFEYKRKKNSDIDYISSLDIAESNREIGMFLVAFNEKTPFYYDLVEQKETECAYIVTYQAKTDHAIIHKTYTIQKNTFAIALNIHIEPLHGGSIVPRVFILNPYMRELGKKDSLSAIIDEDGNVKIMMLKGDELIHSYWKVPKLFGIQDRYFVNAFVDDESTFINRAYFNYVEKSVIQIIFEGNEIAQPTEWNLRFYIGPKINKDLARVSQGLTHVIDYGFLSYIRKPVSNVLRDILNFLYSYVHNYGLAIILLILLVRLIMLPFNLRAKKAMRRQEEINKKIKYLKQRYKDDKEGFEQAQTELIRKHGMPGLGGCLPSLLIQLPIFMGLYLVLSNAIELYQAPFLWISDLSEKDPYYILPVLTGIAYFFNSPFSDGKDIQKYVTSCAMALVIFGFTVNFSAGLSLYICINTILFVLETILSKHWM